MPILPKRVVLQLQPYPRPDEGRHQYARLDFNENTSGFPEAYPPGMPPQYVSAYPEYGQLSERVGWLYGVPSDWVMLTNGSDEGISIVAQTFVEPEETKVVVSKPCFVVIPHSLKLAGAEVREVAVNKDLSFNLVGIEQELKNGAKIAFFATPENPTGSLLDPATLKRWCREFPDTLFAIDEAYGEFAGTTMITAIAECENLVVLRTFSKAWGMAGLRLGVVIARPELIEYMNRVKLPYSVNSAAVWTANQLLDREAEVRSAINTIMSEKSRVVSALQSRGYKVDVGHSNSLLLHAGIHAEPVTQFLRGEKVLVRNRSNIRFPADLNGSRPATWGRVRVSIGTPKENDRFLNALDRFNRSYALIFDLDGTLIDTTASFDQTVAELVKRHTGKPLPTAELQALRAEGGFNDDWLAATELINRRGKKVTFEEICDEAAAMYLEIAHANERLMFDLSLLDRLGARHPLYVVTGRTRPEYDPIWGDRLNSLFKSILCLHDLPQKKPKPSPDYLSHIIEENRFSGGLYVGNAVDDMQAARAAGLDAIGITTTLPANVLVQAGAHMTLSSVEELAEVFML